MPSNEEKSNVQFAGLGFKLQQALLAARAAGLTSQDEVLAQAELIVSSWEDARTHARSQISQYIEEFQNCGMQQLNPSSQGYEKAS
jgi:hypothetical protein